jgi:hypothetical protein
MNNFVEGLKNQIISFCIVRADSFFKKFASLEKIKDKFWLAFMKHLLIVKILPETFFKLLVAAYRKHPVIL